MKNRNFLFLVISFVCIIFITQLKLISRPIQDNDEGVYTTSFLLIHSGHPAYKETFLSQPPGFLLAVYPGFVAFGNSIQAARLMIGLWSIVGLLAIMWISYLVNNKWLGLLTICFLYLIPTYYNQTLVVQSDILVGTFSLLALGCFIKFKENLHLKWFSLTILFLNIAFWTKLDVSLFPALIIAFLLLYKTKKFSLKYILSLVDICIGIASLFFIIFIAPFGMREVFENSILFHLQAAKSSSYSFFNLLSYLSKDIVLCFVLLFGFLIAIFRKEYFKYPTSLFFIWTISLFILLNFYRPLFPHHIALLTIPAAFLCSYSLYVLTKKLNKKIYIFICLFIFSAALINRIYVTAKTSSNILNTDQQKAVNIIKQNTNMNDTVVTDEEILNVFSNRLPPPQLSDVSYVRISSNNLSANEFEKIINTYKPKLIIPWNGRLQTIKNFNGVLKNYRPLQKIGDGRIVYIRRI